MRTEGAISTNGDFVVTDLYLFESGRYNERFLRSLKFGTINDDVIDRLADEINRTNGRGFSSSSISLTKTPVITLEEDVDLERDSIDLVNGWDKKHFCVMMKIVEEAASQYHAPKIYLISGYTDKMEYSKYSKSIPDDLEFFVNSILEISNERSSNNNNLFSSVNSESSRNNLYMMRPQDVLSRFSYNSTRQSKGGGMNSSYRGDWVRDRAIYQSSRNNNIGSSYLAKTLTGLHKNRLEMIGESLTDDRNLRDEDDDNPITRMMRSGSSRGLSRSTELEDELESVRNHVGEDSADDFEFIRAIKNAARDTNSAGAFRFKQLKRLCPDIESIISVNTIEHNTKSRSGLSNQDNNRLGDLDGSRFGNATQEEMIATNILNGFATVATSCFVLMVDIIFALKYDDDEGKFVWDYEIGYEDRGHTEEGSVLFLDMVSDEKQRDLLDRLAQVMIDSVLNSYSRFGYEVVVSVQFNANREMFVNVAVDTDKGEEFCSAIFCDSLTPPVLSSSERRGAKLGENANFLYNAVHKAITR